MTLKQAKELVRSRLSDQRYEHTLNVKKMAVKLAKRYGADEEQAALAALLHDAAKEISKDEMRAIMRAYPEYAEGGEERPTPVWHGICAAILARTEWGVEDEAVLSAIACHTAGKPGMSRQAARPHVQGRLRGHSRAGGGPCRNDLRSVRLTGNENRLQIVGKDAILKGIMNVNRPRMKKLEEI